MSIKKQLQISTACFVILALVILLMSFFTSRQVNEAVETNRMVDGLVKDMFELNSITNDYLRHHEELAQKQWKIKYSSLMSSLQQIQSRNWQEENVAKTMTRNLEDVRALFLQFVAIHDTQFDADKKAPVEWSKRLQGQFSVKLQFMNSSTFQLAEAANKAIIASKQRANIIFGVALVVITSTMLFFLVFIQRRVTTPLLNMHKAVETVAGGHFHYDLDLKRHDEIGSLSRAFKKMVNNLAKSYRFLKKEIEERKRSEENVRQQQDYLEKITNSMWDAVFSIKLPERRIEWANDSFIMFGYEPKEYLGNTTEFLYENKDDFMLFGKGLKGAVDLGKNVFATEMVLKRKNGKTFPADISVTFQRENGELIGAVSVVRDITQRRQEEALLQESEARFRGLFEKTDAISVQGYDRNRKLIYWNPASETLYGYTADKAMGKQLEDLIIPDRMREQVIAGVTAWVDGGSAIPSSELTLRKADGSSIQVFSSHVMFMNYKNEPEMYCIDIDLTALKQAEDTAAEYRDQLEEKVRERTTELQTVVNSMAGREMRMAELKEQIKLLQDQLAEAGLQPIAGAEPLTEKK